MKMKYILTILCYSHPQKWIYATKIKYQTGVGANTEVSLVKLKSEKEVSHCYRIYGALIISSLEVQVIFYSYPH